MAFVRSSHKSGFIRRDGGRRRQTSWIGVGVTNSALASASTATLINAAAASLLVQRPFTIIRSVGMFHIRSDQNSASESYHVGLGACMVSDESVAIGITAVPTPMTDSQSDAWYMYEQAAGRFEVISAIGALEGGVLSRYDSRAMRKCEDDGRSPIYVIETSASSAGATVIHAGRLLIKLH